MAPNQSPGAWHTCLDYYHFVSQIGYKYSSPTPSGATPSAFPRFLLPRSCPYLNSLGKFTFRA